MKRLLFLVFIVSSALFAGVQTFVPTITKAKETLSLFNNVSTVAERVEKNSISFVGDVMLARNVENLMEHYGFWYPFAQLDNLDETSYLVGNFESAIPEVHNQTPDLHFSFSTHPKYLEGLITYGFTHMSVANNHSYDYGSLGFASTKDALEEVGVRAVGDPKHQASSTIEVVTLDGVRVALIGLYAVDVLPSSLEIKTLIENAETQSDLQVVYVHWGAEYKAVHNAFQERLARQLIDEGADVIIGHHPHVVQDIQLYKNKPIFYSLGNFIFDQYFSDAVQQGLMVQLKPVGGNLQFELMPVTSIGSRSAPRTMEGFERDEFFKELSKNSHVSLATMIQLGSIIVPK